MNRRARGWLIVLAIVTALALVAAMIWYVMQLSAPTAEQARDDTLSSESVLAVKIDNVAAPRPQTGLGAAETIYVTPVEGGLTRLLAIYSGELPDAIGPVRSARASDIELLAQYGYPTFAYSGAAPEVLAELADAPLVPASPSRSEGYYREAERKTPHNLYVDPAALPSPDAPPAQRVIQHGDAPAGGIVTASHTTKYGSATFDFTWLAREGWLISMDGTPVTTTEGGKLSAVTVVEQHVDVTSEQGPADALGNRAPTYRTVGTGDATVLRNGRQFDTQWSRPSPDAPTRFTTTGGTPVPMGDGQIWILLVPNS
ncbi:MAG: DUF3048 domain-containing protein [Actinophytocola sp.]|nr:DUF3048 domain-containing protein [Actinophytocola sp.]